MIKKLITYLVFASLMLFSVPSLVGAQAYGSGTYGDCQYGTSCSSTATTTTTTDSTDTNTDTTNINSITILANGQALTPNAEFTQGDPIVFSGTTVPLAEVHLYFQSEPFEAVVNADAKGYWTYTLTKDLGAGEHSLRIAIRIPETNTIGVKSTPKTFILSAVAVSPTVAKKTTTTTVSPWWPYAAIGLIVAAVLATLIWIVKKRRNSTK